LTDECNYRCTYCYQKKRKGHLRFSTLVRAINFFHHLFAPDCCISFFGGEPLLAFDELTKTVEYLNRLSKRRGLKVRYRLTTNGSLLNEDILGFLEEHEFLLTLSFDGLAQDVSRTKGSLDLLVPVIRQILARYPRIALETNSVFSSETVGYLSESVRFIIEMGIPQLGVSLAHTPPWTASSFLRLENEISRVGRYFESRYKSVKDVPWVGFYEKLGKALYGCPAGLNQITLSAQGTLWGCPVFPYYFAGRRGREKYCFGDVNTFIKNAQSIYAKKMANYSMLRMDCFSTPDRACLMCREIEHCSICPLAAAFTTNQIGRIPKWKCQARRILRRKQRQLSDQFKRRIEERATSC
jgi:sulfatase maturation enzyme AslB (radical SAM superfamily)